MAEVDRARADEGISPCKRARRRVSYARYPQKRRNDAKKRVERLFFCAAVVSLWSAMGTPIENTPHIGPTLASHLKAVGIDTLEGLVDVGDADAYTRLTERFPEDGNAQTRLELAGAVRSMRWSTLPMALRKELAADSLAKRRKPL